MSKNVLLVAALTMVLFFNGCGTPLFVKSLSNEEMNALVSYQETLQKYFNVIENYVQLQIQSAELLIKVESQKQMELYKKKAGLKLNEPNADASAIMNELAANIQSVIEGDQEQIKKMTILLMSLKQKHREMLDAYAVILAAQTKLNDYIQLEKADEVFVNQILVSIGIQKEKIAATFDSINSIIKDINQFSQSGGTK